MKTAIFDIDGTIADLTHRRQYIATKPKNYAAFHKGVTNDLPIWPVINVLLAMKAAGYKIVLCSGRDGDFRQRTVDWLARFGVPYDALYMRAGKDYRADDIIKEELLDQILADGYKPEIVFDDRDRVVAMWRRRGLKCAQVEPGDF